MRDLYEGVVAPTLTSGEETWSRRMSERHKLKDMEKKCLESMCGVTRLDRERERSKRDAGLV